MYIVLGLMALGIIIGLAIQNKEKLVRAVDPMINVSIYGLLFLLRMSVGVNKTIINNLDTLGVQALILTLGAVLGSVVLALFTYKFFFKERN